MTVPVVLHTLLSHWRRHRFQFATLFVGLAAATALWTGVQAINTEARSSYAKAERLLGSTRVETVVPLRGRYFDQSLWVRLRRAGVPVSPVVEGRLRAAGERIRLIGIEPISLPAPSRLDSAGADPLRDFTAFATPPHRAYAGPETARMLNGNGGLPPVFPADMAEGAVITDIGVAQELLGLRGRLSRLLLDPKRTAEAAALIETLAGDSLRLIPPQEGSDLSRMTDSLHLNLTAFGFLSFLVGLFIVHAQTGLAFEQRRPMLRTLRACGVSPRTLAGVMAGELVILAAVSGAVGTAAGYLLASALMPDVAASLRGLYGARVPGELSLPPLWWLAGLAISVAGALAASATSLTRAFRLPLLTAAQPRAWRQTHERTIRLQAMACAALLGVALFLFLAGQGLLAGFALLGTVLLAAALGLPVLVSVLLAFLENRSASPLAQWFWSDSRQQLGGISLALMALLLALSVNIGVGTMVGSFRLTFLDWLDHRLTAELYVTASSDEQAGELSQWLAPKVDALLPIWRADSRLGDWPTEVYGVRDDPSYRENWPVLEATPQAWDELAAGRGALISEQLANRLELRPGDLVTLPTSTGDWRVPVAGVYSDYGNPRGHMLVSLEALLAHWPDVEKRRFGARLDPARVPAILDGLVREVGLDRSQMIDRAALKSSALSVFERTFAVTAALSALTLTVAGIALMTGLLTLGSMRLPQIAPLWALGVRRRSLARIALWQTLFLATLTTLAALPVGLAVAWMLTEIVNVRAFGWRLPMHLFPGDWLVLASLAVGAAVAAALVPVLRLLRVPPARLLQVFSGDR
ncbi:MAG: FtsX-like permease family protein [Paracoccaceae bacterium]